MCSLAGKKLYYGIGVAAATLLCVVTLAPELVRWSWWGVLGALIWNLSQVHLSVRGRRRCSVRGRGRPPRARVGRCALRSPSASGAPHPLGTARHALTATDRQLVVCFSRFGDAGSLCVRRWRPDGRCFRRGARSSPPRRSRRMEQVCAYLAIGWLGYAPALATWAALTVLVPRPHARRIRRLLVVVKRRGAAYR